MRQHPTVGTRGSNPYQATRVLLGKEMTRGLGHGGHACLPCRRTCRPLPQSVSVHPNRTP